MGISEDREQRRKAGLFIAQRNLMLADGPDYAKITAQFDTAPSISAKYLEYYTSPGDEAILKQEQPVPWKTLKKIQRDPIYRFASKFATMPLLDDMPTIHKTSGDKDIDAAVLAVFRPIWGQFISTMVAPAFDYGFSACEIPWSRREVKYEVDEKEIVKDLVTIPYIHDLDGEFVEVERTNRMDALIWGADMDAVKLPPYKYQWLAEEWTKGQLYGYGAATAAWNGWWKYGITIAYALQKLERQGQMPVIVKYPIKQVKDTATMSIDSDSTQNLNAEAQEAALAIGDKISGPSPRVAMPSEPELYRDPSTGQWKPTGKNVWDITQLKESPDIKGFLEIAEIHKREIFWSCLIPDHAIDKAEYGSQAEAIQKGDMLAKATQARLSNMYIWVNGNRWHDGMVQNFVRFNFGVDAPCPELGSPGVDPESLGLQKLYIEEIFKKLAQDGSATFGGLEIAIEDVFNKFDIPYTEAEKIEELEPPVTPIKLAATDKQRKEADKLRGERNDLLDSAWGDMDVLLGEQMEKVSKTVFKDLKGRPEPSKARIDLDKMPYASKIGATEKEYIEKSYRLGYKQIKGSELDNIPVYTKSLIVTDADDFKNDQSNRVNSAITNALIDNYQYPANFDTNSITNAILSDLANYRDKQSKRDMDSRGMRFWAMGRKQALVEIQAGK